jgi:hypothetical protein
MNIAKCLSRFFCRRPTALSHLEYWRLENAKKHVSVRACYMRHDLYYQLLDELYCNHHVIRSTKDSQGIKLHGIEIYPDRTLTVEIRARPEPYKRVNKLISL